MLYLANAFSLQMIRQFDKCILHIKKIDVEECKEILENVKFESAIGHDSTAKAVETIIKRPVPVNRVNLTLTNSDLIIVFQFVGGRPPEGTVLQDVDFLRKNMEIFLIDFM